MQYKYYFNIFILLFLFLSPVLTLGTNTHNYNTYYNSRFRYSIDYPISLVVSAKEKGNDSGQTFISSDGKIKLVVWGGVHPTNAKEGYQAEIEQDKQLHDYKITYTKLEKDYYIISGVDVKNKKMFYMKSVYEDKGNINFYIEYPLAEKNDWAKILPHISYSLKYVNK